MSQGDRLLNRPRLSGEHPIRIDDDAEARKDVEQARTLLQILQFQGDSADQSALRQAKARLKRAETKLRACYEFVPLRAMEADAFEVLMGQHKPREGTDDKTWNLDTFPRACLLACDESGRSEADWAHIWKSVLTGPEQTDLCNSAIRLNIRTPDSTLPKGWTQIQD